jgi:hypothetical protein
VARHRSPRSRSAHQPSPYALVTSAAGGGRGAHRITSTPLRRGATAVAVAGGALTLVGAGVPMAIESADADVSDLATYTALSGTGQQPTVDADTLVRSTLEPVAPAPAVDVATDGAALVKAVQMVEQQVAAQQAAAAEQAAAEEQRAAEERADDEDPDPESDYAAEESSGGGATGSPGCDIDTSQLGAVKAHVMDAAQFLGCLFGEPTMLGVAGRAGTSDHPGGLAVDFMVDRATGDRLAECALRNQDALGIKYVIWEQRINHGSGWEAMEDRGSATANHFDHVHVSFSSTSGSGDPVTC